MKSIPEKEFNTEVLIIGGGTAGCLAAIGAREQGAEVLVIEKGGAIERSGSLASGIDHYFAFLGEAPWDTPEAFLEAVPKARGRPIDLNVALTFARHNRKVFELLERIGVPFRDRQTGQYRRVAPLGDTYPTAVNFEGGNIKRILAQHIRTLGVRVEEKVAMQGLLTTGDRVTGAGGFHIRRGELCLFRAKSVVIATGGVVRLYPPPSGLVYMSMDTPFNTGDGHAMAFRAGAQLTNMEFTACSIVPQGFSAPGITGFVGLGARLINSSGERYLLKYHRLGEHAPRNAVIRATLQEIEAGRGPCYVDCRHLSKKELEYIRLGLLNEKPLLLDYFQARGLDISKEPIPYVVRELDCWGSGIMIDERCRGSLEGLFSAGDCSNLSLGAAGACTLGYVAGTEAARHASKVSQQEIDAKQVTELRQQIFSPLQRKQGVSPWELESELRGTMSKYLGFTRDASGLEMAMQSLQRLRSQAEGMVAHNYHELMKANEATNLIDVATIIAKAAWERRETRAAPLHIRTDYPDRDDAKWLGFLVVEKRGEQVRTWYRPARLSQ